MQNVLGRVARMVGLYGPLRSMKARWDRRRPEAVEHQDKMRRFYGAFVRAGDVVFDIGCNNGNRAEIFLGLGARVVGVEPQPGCQGVLRRLFGHEPGFTLVGKALGESEGEARMFLNDASVLATMSREWMDKTAATGRFEAEAWRKEITVPITTLDRLIAEHGEPAFCKIDVEGFELHVLRGLTRPVRALSLEVMRESADTIVACVDRLSSLARYEYNYSLGESMEMERERWMSPEEASEFIRTGLAPGVFADLYARRA